MRRILKIRTRLFPHSPILIMGILLLLIIPFPLFAGGTGGPLLTARLLNQQPPAAPAGSTVQIHISIENVGTERTDVYAYKLILPRGAVQLTPREEWVTASSLDAAQQASTGLILTYTIRLPSDATSGTLSARLIAKKEGIVSTLATIPLTIRNPSSIAINSTVITPETLRPGEEGLITLQLSNTGADTYQNIPVTISSTSLTYPQGNVRIITLPPYETRTIRIPIRVLPTVPPGYASYTIQAGNLTWQGMLTINGTPQYVLTLEAVKDEFDARSITIGVANSGSMSLRNVVISVDNATPTSVAIGRLDEDDYDTATMTIPQSLQRVTGRITYRDAYGARHEEAFTFALPPLTEARTTPWQMIGILILIFLAVYLFFRGRKKDRLTPISTP